MNSRPATALFRSSFILQRSSFMADDLLSRVPTFVLVFFRLAGMMAFAPLFGSTKIPRRVKVLLVLVLTFGMFPNVPRPHLPDSIWELAVGIGGELCFGIAMGMAMSFTFVAAQWAGEMIGQQMGLNISEVFDPQYGGHGSLVGDMYFMLALVVFLALGGHHAVLTAVHQSSGPLPLLSLGVDEPVVALLVGLLKTATGLAVQLAAPMLVTMLVVDLALGLVGRAMPQFNVMQAGVSVRTILGMVVVIGGLTLARHGIRPSLARTIGTAQHASPAAA